MTPSIAITCRFDWRKQEAPFVSSHTLPFLCAIQRRLRDFQVWALDWGAIRNHGTASIFDVTDRRPREISLKALSLLHVFNLGRPANRSVSLRDKWQQVIEKLQIVDAAGVRLINPFVTIRYGVNKNYLLDLAAKRLPIIPTRIVSSCIPLQELKKACSPPYGIVKPANGECGKLVLLIEKITEADMEQYRRESDELLLQPLAPEVIAGEKSLVFLGKAFSHAVRKIPSAKDFRANGPHTNACIYPYLPTASELELARRVQAEFPHPLDTFRLDIVGDGTQSKVMEVEVVDPGHYCALSERHAQGLSEFYEGIYAQMCGGTAAHFPRKNFRES